MKNSLSLRNRIVIAAVLFVGLGLPIGYVVWYDYLVMHGVHIERDDISEKIAVRLPASARLVYGRYFPVRDPMLVAVLDVSDMDIDNFLSSSPANILWIRYDKHQPLRSDFYKYNDYTDAQRDAAAKLFSFKELIPWAIPDPGERFIWGKRQVITGSKMKSLDILIVFDGRGKRTMYLRWLGR